jgi:hypothetical protein
VGAVAASLAIVALTTCGCGTMSEAHPMSAPSVPEIAGSDVDPSRAPEDGFTDPTGDRDDHPNSRESARMWSTVSRFAPATSPYERARGVCLRMVRPRMPTDSAASLACVPPYLWRFRGEEKQTDPSHQPGDLMRSGSGDH